MTVLSDRIRQEREYVGYSVAELAGRLGIPAGEFEAFETDAAEPPAADLARIAWLCGTTRERLHGEDLRAGPDIEEATENGLMGHDEAYELLRFAELLRVRKTDEPQASR